MAGQVRSNIAGAINAAHAGVEAAKREGARYAVECGRLLIEAKETVPHGGWDAWLRTNTKVSPRTAQLYMRIARHVEADPAKAQRVAGLSVREAAAEVAGPKRAALALPPLTPEGEAQLEEMRALWAEALTKPHWKEGFARWLHLNGHVSREERDRIIRANWAHPDLSKADRQTAAAEAAMRLRGTVPPEEWRAVLPLIERHPGSDIAIAVRDAVEARANGD